MTRHYTPRVQIFRQRLAAIVLFISAGLALYAGVIAAHGNNVLVTLVLAAGLAILARYTWRKSCRRIYGISIERASTRDALHLAPWYGLVSEANLLIPGRGDVDLALSRGGLYAAVEIKSFRYWGAKQERCMHAIQQAHRNSAAIRGVLAVVWLPNAKTRFWRSNCFRHEGALVVLGGVKRLLRAVSRELY